MSMYQGETYSGEFEGEFEQEYEEESPFAQAHEAEIASELLEITNEEELEEFLGDLVKAAGKFIKGPVGSALGGVLKDVAKTALPVVGGALGSFVAPGIGTAIGSKLGSMAGNLFEMGYETNYEDEQFETARQVVRLATTAAQTAQSAPPNMPPHVVAEQAVQRAAQQLGIGAPQHEQEDYLGGGGRSRRSSGSRSRVGYGTSGTSYSSYGGDQDDGYEGDAMTSNGGPAERPVSGRWVRRGRRIILHGV